MNLFEFEGKKLLEGFGVPYLRSALVYSPSDPAPLPFPFVLKAQVMAGGRGKAGGVKVCRTQADYDKYVRDIFGLTIKGQTVPALMAAEMGAVEREWYLSITLQGVSRPVLMASPAGGMDIEEVARTRPEKLLRMEIEPFVGLKNYQLRRLSDHMGAENPSELWALAENLYRAFQGLDAELVELNPLATVGGKLIALDAKVVLDDHASRRQSAVFADIAAGRALMPSYVEPEKEKTTITFVPLEGNVALISDGAGTGMLTLDLVGDNGGRVASFCELGGVTNAEVMHRAMDLSLSADCGAKSVLIVLIGGFNRMDHMAEGIVRYLSEHKLDIPVFTRMCGTLEAEGKAMMAAAGYETMDDLAETVRRAVRAAKEAR